LNGVLDFSGKVALVTGAAAGMGLATAKAFADAGAAVVLADYKEETAKAAAQALIAGGHKAIALRCDVSNDAQIAAMVDRAIDEFGRIDAAFNNAGVMAHIAPIADSAREDWDRVIGVNLRGVELHEARAAADGTSRERRDRQQCLSRRFDRQSGYCFLHRIKTRCGWSDTDGRARVCEAWHSRECSQSRTD
jgi:NAD(P)-dependent dehydrogenase (short-subunit alcohol dehydrogenase family)